MVTTWSHLDRRPPRRSAIVNEQLRKNNKSQIIPIDSEGSYLFRKVPVVQTEATVGSKDVAKLAAEMLREYKIFMLRGHGCFSIGPVLEEAFQWCSSLEESCKIYHYMVTLQAAQATISEKGLGDLEYRKHTDDYQTW